MKNSDEPLQPCPYDAIEADGVPAFGVWRGTPRTVELGRWASPWQLAFRQKRWQYVAVFDGEAIVGVAVADLGYLGLAFMLALERPGRRWHELEEKAPLRLAVTADGGPGEGLHRFDGRTGSIEMALDGGRRTIKGRMSRGSTDIEVDLALMPASGKPSEPLTCVAPLPPGGVNVTHKIAGLAAAGTLRTGDRTHRFDPATALAILDWTRGVPPYRTSWNWAMGAGRSADGRIIGFNVCVGYNDAIDSENAVWIDGALRRLGRVRFGVPAPAGASAWTVRSDDGALDLRFQPEGMRAADENYLLLASRYCQPVGTFSGRIADIEVEAITGVAEDHYARW